MQSFSDLSLRRIHFRVKTHASETEHDLADTLPYKHVVQIQALGKRRNSQGFTRSLLRIRSVGFRGSEFRGLGV